MILVDTTVWIDHLRSSESKLIELLQAGSVLIHSMVIGELACGTMKARAQRLNDWKTLPRIVELSHESVWSVIESRNLMGRGIGFIDAHLLCAVLGHNGTLLWTRDRSLKSLAQEFGVLFPETV